MMSKTGRLRTQVETGQVRGGRSAGLAGGLERRGKGGRGLNG